MYASNKVTYLPLYVLLFLVTFDCLRSCAGAQIHKRYIYDSNSADATDTIPLEFYEELSNVSDISEFIERFVNNNDPQLGIQDSAKRSVERAAVVMPKPALCKPENTIVPLTPLNPSTDPKVIYYPECTRVKRCGGCCNTALISCQPTATEVINFEVVKFRYGSNTSSKEIVLVEQHTQCKCACRIKEEDCNSYQQYQGELCRCVCTNNEARDKCLGQQNKIWDDKECKCACINEHVCTTGTFFDKADCKCIEINHTEFFD